MQDYPKERRVGPCPPLPQVLLGYAKFRAHWRLLRTYRRTTRLSPGKSVDRTCSIQYPLYR
jgi:hypothetical protein